MPCNCDYMYPTDTELKEQVKEVKEVNNTLVQLLCQVCEQNESTLKGDVLVWWNIHKKEDQKRRDAEEQKRKAEEHRIRNEIKRLTKKLGNLK